ncbi:Hypothetical_protein [Hexamita inflata]|uniref:Hypothetical_protein n=1 Tax=Hexamita inflata TaxID=28002 RepID=A0AA86UUT9_9EUKA|nr:Hypothetical protein HINF_LOCUS53086 [Hexamita inflata]
MPLAIPILDSSSAKTMMPAQQKRYDNLIQNQIQVTNHSNVFQFIYRCTSEFLCHLHEQMLVVHNKIRVVYTITLLLLSSATMLQESISAMKYYQLLVDGMPLAIRMPAQHFELPSATDLAEPHQPEMRRGTINAIK